jgi:dCMP deaminase
VDNHCVRTLHAEQNAIIQAALHGVSVNGSTIYVTHQPCLNCAKMIINAGVKRVVYAGDYPDLQARTFLSEAGVALSRLLSNSGSVSPTPGDGQTNSCDCGVDANEGGECEA